MGREEMKPKEEDIEKIKATEEMMPPAPVTGFGTPMSIAAWGEMGCPASGTVVTTKKKCEVLANQFADAHTVESLGMCNTVYVRAAGGDWAQCCQQGDPNKGMTCRSMHQDSKIKCPGCRDDDSGEKVCLSEGLPSHEGGLPAAHVCVSLGPSGTDDVIFLARMPLPLALLRYVDIQRSRPVHRDQPGVSRTTSPRLDA